MAPRNARLTLWFRGILRWATPLQACRQGHLRANTSSPGELRLTVGRTSRVDFYHGVFFTFGFAAVRRLAHGLFRWRALSYWQWRFDKPDTWPQNGAATGTVRVDGALFLRATCRRLAPILDERRRLEKWLPATAEATPAAQN